jgi:hypothetical protein
LVVVRKGLNEMAKGKSGKSGGKKAGKKVAKAKPMMKGMKGY